LQSKYRLEDAQTESPLIANDNWAEYTLRYVVGYKTFKLNKLFTKILSAIEATKGEVKMAGHIPFKARFKY
jgi:hypothetical protein